MCVCVQHYSNGITQGFLGGQNRSEVLTDPERDSLPVENHSVKHEVESCFLHAVEGGSHHNEFQRYYALQAAEHLSVHAIEYYSLCTTEASFVPGQGDFVRHPVQLLWSFSGAHSDQHLVEMETAYD